MDKKYYKGLYGIDGALNAFAKYANEVLPEEIADKAVPETTWLKREYGKDSKKPTQKQSEWEENSSP